MDASRPEQPVPKKVEAPLGAAVRSDDAPSAGGMEINLGDFTRTQGLMKSLRLLLDNQLVVQVEEIASGLSEAGRKFKIGDLEQAHLDVVRLYSSFGQKTNQWEGQARNLEQQMRTQAAKNPKSISIDKMNRMKSEQTAVRTRIRTAEVQFRRLHQGLDQAFTNFKQQPVPSVPETPSILPSGFLSRFQAATPADCPQIVNEFFEIEAILKVTVTKSPTAGYDIKFAPLPPLSRLYFFTATAQLICLHQLGNTVLIEDLETGQNTELRLVEFVKQVQTGAWLLQPRSA